MRSAIAILAVLSGSAHADLNWSVHVGGGMEGGGGARIVKAVRPDGVMEAGMIVEYINTNGNAGIGASVEAVGRLTPRFEDAEEIKADGMFRWAGDDRRFRFGVGAGIRLLTPRDGKAIQGYDLIRLDMSGVLASWKMAPAMPQMSFEGYVSWTFGCYSDSYDGERIGDMKPARHDIGCVDSITSTYVVGLRTTVSWR
ncbi:MAG: hypothetical protein H0T46_05910 [Deltaproteobacteria bacterium]|nr:hypothetical protein [Deltaproteobacteria bacterium]